MEPITPLEQIWEVPSMNDHNCYLETFIKDSYRFFKHADASHRATRGLIIDHADNIGVLKENVNELSSSLDRFGRNFSEDSPFLRMIAEATDATKLSLAVTTELTLETGHLRAKVKQLQAQNEALTVATRLNGARPNPPANPRRDLPPPRTACRPHTPPTRLAPPTTPTTPHPPFAASLPPPLHPHPTCPT